MLSTVQNWTAGIEKSLLTWPTRKGSENKIKCKGDQDHAMRKMAMINELTDQGEQSEAGDTLVGIHCGRHQTETTGNKHSREVFGTDTPLSTRGHEAEI